MPEKNTAAKEAPPIDGYRTGNSNSNLLYDNRSKSMDRGPNRSTMMSRIGQMAL